MKKVFAIAAIAAAALFAGNTVNAQLGINVGYAPQTYNTNYTSGSVSTSNTAEMNGLFAGVNYNTELTGDLALSLGVQYRLNTKETSNTTLGVTTTTKDNQSLIDVPILFNYGINLTDDFKVSVFLGPTVSYALSGSTENTVGSVAVTTDWYNENEGNMSALDMSLTAGACLTFSDFRLFGGYNMGLLNLSKTDNTTMKGSNIFVGLGYNL